MNACDLKQGEMYNECLRVIRDQPLEGFDGEVMMWLKKTRYMVMKDIDVLTKFYFS
jgi:hypothetical protein